MSTTPISPLDHIRRTIHKLDRIDRRWSLRVALGQEAHAHSPSDYWLARVVTHLGDSWVWWLVAVYMWQRAAPGKTTVSVATTRGLIAHLTTRLTNGLSTGKINRPRARVLGWLGALLVTTLTVFGVKQLIQRPRPGTDRLLYGGGPDQYSFPSGHAARMGVLAVWAPLYGRRATGVMMLLAFLVSWSRVRLGIHYLGDVLAGFAIGAALGLAGRVWRRDLTEKKASS
jgi:membrane-associated phospholipid phosphatase